MNKQVIGGNLWRNWTTEGNGEVFDTLLSRPGVRVERILTRGHSSAKDFWYDQPQGEWVVVLSGSAQLQIEGELRSRELRVGDWLWLPPHCRHRVEATDGDQDTLWLAVHCGEIDEEPGDAPPLRE